MVRGKVLFEPAALPALSTKVTLDYQESDLGESRPIVSTGFGPTSPEFETFDYLDYEGNGRFPNNENEGFRIVSDTSYALTEYWTAKGVVTYEDSSTDRLFGDPNFISEFGGLTFNQFDEEVFSIEGRLDFEYEDFRGLIGLYYFEEGSVLNRDIQSELLPQILAITPPPLQPLVSVNPSDSLISLQDGDTTETENRAIFGQIEYDFSPKWTLNLGFRYDEEEFAVPNEFSSTSLLPDTCTATIPAVLLKSCCTGPDNYDDPALRNPCHRLCSRRIPAWWRHSTKL
ncbi:MAG: TonB-dependent receptor [Pseudomonadota bacterium]